MIEVRRDVKGIASAWVARIVSGTLRREKIRRRAVTVFLTGDKKIRALNKKFLKHDYATDVISFGSGEKSGYLGDLVVSVETARKVSKDLRISFKEELARYLVHGTLHLLGYDDKKKKNKARMHRRQEFLLRKILASGCRSGSLPAGQAGTREP